MRKCYDEGLIARSRKNETQTRVPPLFTLDPHLAAMGFHKAPGEWKA